MSDLDFNVEKAIYSDSDDLSDLDLKFRDFLDYQLEISSQFGTFYFDYLPLAEAVAEAVKEYEET